jgi:hypothetical protein
MTNLSTLLRDLKAVSSRNSSFGAKSQGSVQKYNGGVKKHKGGLQKHNKPTALINCEEIIRRIFNLFMSFFRGVTHITRNNQNNAQIVQRARNEFNAEINGLEDMTDQPIIFLLTNLYNQLLQNNCFGILQQNYPRIYNAVMQSQGGTNIDFLFWLFQNYQPVFNRTRGQVSAQNAPL